MTDEIPECFRGNGIEMTKDDFCYCGFCAKVYSGSIKAKPMDSIVEVK
jgi:hypothetical protein